MRAIAYSEHGDTPVRRLVDRRVPAPGPGEVRVAVHISGINPTDWKSRSRLTVRGSFDEVVPNQDGAGVSTASARASPGSDRTARLDLGGAEREARRYRAGGGGGAGRQRRAAAAYSLLRAGRVARSARADRPSLSDGRRNGPAALVPGALAARRVPVAGRRRDRRGAPAVNAALDAVVLAQGGTIAVYANNGGASMSLEVRPHTALNAGYQFVLLYTVPEAAKRQALLDGSAAVAAGAFRVGAEGGLPLHRYPLERTAEAHGAVEQGAVGKVLIDVV
jgi:NADPH2:quinone reductase